MLDTLKTLLIVLAGLAASVALVAPSAAAAPGGLFWEKYATADGVRVRRLSDPEKGVVCYVASSHAGVGYNNSPAISCVADKKGAP